ncbi:MAG: 4Fe-4S binding protein [Syntrophomonas sp.]|nr:4Fe-4S binding protein [Syntrophomonas sp.]
MKTLLGVGLGILLTLILALWLILERRLRPHKSTVLFWHLSELPLMKKIEGYFYASRPDWYLKPVSWPWFMHRFIARESADTYHGKMLTQQDASKIISLQKPLILTDLEHVIPYPLARSIVLQHPLPSLAVVECPCRAQKEDACLPRDVCLVVGEPYTSFILDHQPDKARRITVEEALNIIEEEEQRGHIHTAWFKDVMHNRFYTICNCCSCCCLGMKSYFRGVPRLAHSGYSPVFDNETCSYCGSCESVCPFQAIETNGDFPVLKPQLCMGCGLCVSHCPNEAIKLVLAPSKGIPLDVEQLV